MRCGLDGIAQINKATADATATQGHFTFAAFGL